MKGGVGAAATGPLLLHAYCIIEWQVVVILHVAWLLFCFWYSGVLAVVGTLVAYCALGHRACHFQLWKQLMVNKSAHGQARLRTGTCQQLAPAPRSR